MVQIIDDPYSGSAFGRLGRGIGQGLSEQLPKEIERTRLASGLKKLNAENVKDPFEFFTKALSIPGLTPQAIQSLGELSRQRLQGEALKNFGSKNEISSFPGLRKKETSEMGEERAPSITTRAPIEATIKPFIPRDNEQILADAARSYEENPAFFKNDPQAAIAFEQQKDATELARTQALQAQRKSQQDVQNVVRSDLNSQHARLGGKVPSEVYSKIEDKAINAVKPVSEGGEGLTEQQAIKKYGQELNAISKSYNQLFSLGKLNQLKKGSTESQRVLKNLQDEFAKRDEQEIFAKLLQTENGLSPSFAYRFAYPISATPALEKYLKDVAYVPGFGPISPKEKRVSPEKVYENVANLMDRKSGPIAIAEYLGEKGYDPDAFLNFLKINQEKYLTGEQARQLTEARNSLPSLNDLFLRSLIERGKA